MNNKLEKLLLSRYVFLFVSMLLYSCEKKNPTYSKGYIKYQVNGYDNYNSGQIRVSYSVSNGLAFYASPSSVIGELQYTQIAPRIQIRNLVEGKKYFLSSNSLSDGYSYIKLFSGDQPYCDYDLLDPGTENNYFIIDKEQKDFKCIEGRFNCNYYLKGNYFSDALLPDTIRISNGEFKIY
jgi:hypothetical protein